MKKKKKIKLIILILCSLIILSVFISGVVMSERLEVEIFKIDENDETVKLTILEISDLHYPKNRVKTEDIIKVVNDIKPDLIFLTGDIIDRDTTNQEIEELNGFLNGIKENQIYAVLGNHENDNNDLNTYKELLSNNGITLLEDTYNKIMVKEKDLYVIGLKEKSEYVFNTVFPSDADVTIPALMLAHHPDNVESYFNTNNSIIPKVIFTGHAHGGQFMFFNQGVLVPDQGFFPEYFNGLHKSGDNYMVISRGLGNSIFPIRLFNSYNLPVIELYI